jgi:predicted Zn finger-like uncharacterized protein
MKFLCDNCKAKYQIADDKVAGKTVRMKCRKCGHLIEIRASVTDASVATGLPPEAILSDRPPAAETPAPAKAATAPRAVPGPSAGAKKPVPSAGATKPSAPLKPATAGAPKPAPRPGGGLASAFNKAVKDEPKPIEDENVTRALDMSSPASSEEWYVGVNGVPVGPVRLAEIRAKVQQGGITEDSLVWREGFEEWLPLKTFPELLELLEGIVHSGRSVTPPPTSARAGSLSNPASAPRSAPPPRSNVIPFGRGATAEKLDEEPRADAMADPFAAPPPVAAVPAPAPSGLDAVAIPAPAPVPAFSPSEAPPERRRAGGIPPAAWVAIVAALATGVTAGSVLFSKAPPPPTVQIVTVTAPAPAVPVPTATGGSADPGTDPKPDGSVAAPKATGGPRVAANNPPPDKKDDTTPPAPLPGVGALPGGGPSPLPGGGPTPGGGGGGTEQLSQSDVQRVVNNGKNSLKRACWEPALAARSANAPSSARVTVNIVIGPDGRVRSANATGGDGYPGLASCIGGRVRSWVFPPSSGETTVAPSFTFVPQ